MQIRAALPSDAAHVAAIVERAYSGYVERIGMRPGPMEDDYEEKVRGGTVFVAEEGGAVVGLIVLASHSDHLLVENVAVDPERQGQGTGRELLAHAEDVAQANGLDTLRLYTHALMTENQALYASLGYREDERRREHGFERVFLSKRLDPR
jgi:ribosomal protein S18 acetylase RimI-like enzyme